MERIQGTHRVCLITPGHIASDPRLVKEATALSAAGCAVHIVFTQYLEYLAAYDDQILRENPGWTYSVIDWTSRSFASRFNRLKSGLKKLLAAGRPAMINRHYSGQLNAAISVKADLYIAHNLGALPVAANAAKHNRAKSGFDAEDFHRFEMTDDPLDPDAALKIAVEDTYIPRVDYMTASSSGIAQRYGQLYALHKPVVIRNVFPRSGGVSYRASADGGPLRLFWFSQSLGLNRGLADIIAVLQELDPGMFELHLLGHSSVEIRTILAANQNADIRFYAPVPPGELPLFASRFDIGLALEPGFSINNDLALSNKIFTYLQAGLCVIASNTSAQAEFMERYPQSGRLYPKGDRTVLKKILLELYHDRGTLLRLRRNAFDLAASELNWEKESEKFIDIVRGILQ